MLSQPGAPVSGGGTPVGLEIRMSKLDILKSLAPGFLPLIIFIVADSFWGTKIGLIVAIAVGIIEIAISYIKEKIIDRFVQDEI